MSIAWQATYSRTGYLSSFDDLETGNGLSIIIWDAKYSFQPGGIGSSLGYTNYRGRVERSDRDELADMYLRGVQGGHIGIGLDVDGNYSNTTEGKTSTLGNSSGISSINTNSIGFSGSVLSAYQVLTTTANLSTINPEMILHQTVTDIADLEYYTCRIKLRGKGTTLLVDLKKTTEESFTNYITYDLSDHPAPQDIRVALAFSTSDKIMACNIKNFNIYGKTVDFTSLYNGHLGTWVPSGANYDHGIEEVSETPFQSYTPYAGITPVSAFIPWTV